MLSPVYTNQFAKDVKLSTKRGKDLHKLKDIINVLIGEGRLPEKNRDHKLVGNFAQCRECHIEPDWLLIYKIHGQEIFFVRTGTHSDLFD